jgi:hypothetical protein
MPTLRQETAGGYTAVVEQVYPAQLETAPLGRHLVISALTGWGLASVVDDADSVTAELIANAIRQGQLSEKPEILVRVGRAGEHVDIQVGDHCPAGPPIPPADVPADSEHGRGLVICHALAQVGWFQDGAWKVVWAALPAPQTSGETPQGGRGQLGVAA